MITLIAESQDEFMAGLSRQLMQAPNKPMTRYKLFVVQKVGTLTETGGEAFIYVVYEQDGKITYPVCLETLFEKMGAFSFGVCIITWQQQNGYQIEELDHKPADAVEDAWIEIRSTRTRVSDFVSGANVTRTQAAIRQDVSDA